VADEEWDLGDAIQRPEAVSFIDKLAGISHIGVVVTDVDRTVATYARLFGVPRWRGMHWHTEPGWLEEPTYLGEPVEHSYSMGRADVGKNEAGMGIGFEVCQPESGPSHFKEDFLIPRGEGVHHLALPFPMKDVYDWVDFNKWLDEDLQVPTCMSAWLREHTRLSVWRDTTPLLGFVIEYGIQAGRGRPADFWYDFSEELGIKKAEGQAGSPQ
jgi:catechol 2,3-dioxygenase-like lactoylglutathione lyase family enzyme